MVRLSDVVQVSAGQGAPKKGEFSDDGLPFVRAGSLANLLNGGTEDDCEHVSEHIASKRKLRLYPKDSILFAKSGMSATMGRIYRLRKPSYVVNHLAVLLPTGKYDPAYLAYWLLRYPPSGLIQDPAYPSIRLSDISDLRVPDIALDEQRRIAAILDKADDIRRKREQALSMADDFLRSAFLEMFGDPASNPKGWPVGTIRDLLTEAKYGTSKKADVASGQFPILRMGNLTYEGGWKMADLKYIDLDETEKKKYLVQCDDILFNRTNSKELVGKTAVFDLDEPFAFAGYLVRARTNENADPYYVSAYMNSNHGKTSLRAMCKSIVGMANINAQEFQNIAIALPPVGLQKEFRRVVEATKKTKAINNTALAEAGALFASLSQRAFRGEL